MSDKAQEQPTIERLKAIAYDAAIAERNFRESAEKQVAALNAKVQRLEAVRLQAEAAVNQALMNQEKPFLMPTLTPCPNPPPEKRFGRLPLAEELKE